MGQVRARLEVNGDSGVEVVVGLSRLETELEEVGLPLRQRDHEAAVLAPELRLR